MGFSELAWEMESTERLIRWYWEKYRISQTNDCGLDDYYRKHIRELIVQVRRVRRDLGW